MRGKSLFLVSGFILWCSCVTDDYLPGFDFKLFNDSEAEELAHVVEAEDTLGINKILQADPDKANYQEPKFGNTVLMLAVANSKTRSVEALLENEADPNLASKDEGYNALTVACDNIYVPSCDTSVVEAMIRHGADLNLVQFAKEDSSEQRKIIGTPLNIAISSGKCYDFIVYLVTHGADIISTQKGIRPTAH